VKKVKRSTVKRRAWEACSIYIRTRWSTDGYNQCITCGTTHPIAELDAGHFIPRTAGMAVYFDEWNIFPQCRKCNRFLEGNGPAYTLYMVDTYGRDAVDELMARSRTLVKLSTQDLLDIEAYYKGMME